MIQAAAVSLSLPLPHTQSPPFQSAGIAFRRHHAATLAAATYFLSRRSSTAPPCCLAGFLFSSPFSYSPAGKDRSFEKIRRRRTSLSHVSSFSSSQLSFHLSSSGSHVFSCSAAALPPPRHLPQPAALWSELLPDSKHLASPTRHRRRLLLSSTSLSLSPLISFFSSLPRCSTTARLSFLTHRAASPSSTAALAQPATTASHF